MHRSTNQSTISFHVFNLISDRDGTLKHGGVGFNDPGGHGGEEVGLLHLRLKCTPMLPDLIAAAKDRNPHASLLRNPKTYSKQFAMSAADYAAAKAAGMASAVSGLMPSVPLPKKYVDSAAKTMTKTAIGAINAPAKQGCLLYTSPSPRD